MNNNQLFVQKLTGNIGIGTITPSAKLDVLGNVKIADGTQGLGKVLTSDANGLAVWAAPATLPSGSNNQTLRYNGSNLESSSALINTGSSIGIGESNPQGILHVSQPFNFVGVNFSGSGLNDLIVNNSGYTGSGTNSYVIRINNAGPDPNIIEISNDGGTTFSAPTAITTTIVLANGVTASFAATGGHTFGDQWAWTIGPSFNNILVANNGKVGIGTALPNASLDIAGNVKISDGTQGAGKFLTSDVNGFASWTSLQNPWIISGNDIFNNNTGSVGIGTSLPNSSALLDLNSTNKGVLFPQISIDSLKDVTSIANPANGLIVYNTTQPGARNDMARGYYYYSTNAATWVRLADNLNDNPFQNGGLLGIQLRDKTKGVEMLDNYTGSSINWQPKVKILKMVDSALLNFKDNITALVLTGVNRKLKAGWEFRQKTSIVFENNYMLPDGITSASGNNVAISAYTENTLPNQTTQSQGLAFYVTAPPQNTAVADTPSLAMYRHNVGIGAYPTDINNVTEGRLQITGFSNGDQMSIRHPSSINLKWGLYVSSIDSSLNFYSNGSLRANIDRVTGVYSALSDRNLKKNIEPLKPVLPNINKLIPYIYNYTDSKDGDRKAIGFMAQDVEPYFPDLVFDKKDRVTGEPFKMMTYQSFGVIAIKAIQELQLQITAKDETAKALEQKVDKQQQLISNQTELLQKQQAQIDAILQKLNALDKSQQECCTLAQSKTVNQTETLQSVESAMLEQNIPNPFNENTVIRFKIPASSKSAQLMITDVKGTIIKAIPLTQKGEGNITLRAGTLSQGTYFYSLIVDGKKTDTKQMQMIK